MQKYIKYVGETKNLKDNTRRLKFIRLNIKYLLKAFYLILLLSIGIAFYTNNNWKSHFLIDVKTNFDVKENINNAEEFLTDLHNKYLWNIDIEKVRKEVLTLTKLKNIGVKIILPNIVYISGFKRKPYAIWWDYKKFYLVDDEGIILSDNITEEEKKKYILVVGENAIDNLGKIITILSETKQNGKVASIRFIGQRRWDLVLNNGMILKLPEKNELSAINLFEILLELNINLIDDHSIIDMRLAPEKVFITNNKKH